MANENGGQPPQPLPRRPELLPTLLAIALAVAAQLALQDGLTFLGLAGFIVAAWLFITSVRDALDSPIEQRPAETTPQQLEAAGAEASEPPAAVGRLGYLRRNWRLVTLAEILRGDIPPARLEGQDSGAQRQPRADDEPELEVAQAAARPAQAARPARLRRWAATEWPASRPWAVKVTPQGEVLVLDTGLAQVQRFDAGGRLLFTYALAELADLEVMDLAVSPDGRTLYVLDGASRRLQVIALVDDEAAGEEE